MTAKKPLEEIEANRARANEKRRLRHLWKGEHTLEEICEEMSMGEAQLLAFADTLGLSLDDRPEIDVYLPSPEEIRLATAETRAGWSPAELESRRMPWFGMLR